MDISNTEIIKKVNSDITFFLNRKRNVAIDKPKKPNEIPVPGKNPETIPTPEPEPGIWPLQEPEIQPEREPLTTPPTAPPEIPKPAVSLHKESTSRI